MQGSRTGMQGSAAHEIQKIIESPLVYRVHSESMQCYISDFRSEVKSGNEPSPYDIGIILILYYQEKFRAKIIPIWYDEGPLPA